MASIAAGGAARQGARLSRSAAPVYSPRLQAPSAGPVCRPRWHPGRPALHHAVRPGAAARWALRAR